MKGIDSLVANTVYLKAQNLCYADLRDQRLALFLPKPLRLPSGSRPPYDFLCEQQPIGKRLFRDFLVASNVQYVAAAEFLEELDKWALAEDEARDGAMRSIITRFCQRDSESFLSFLTDHTALQCQDVSEKDFEEVMACQVKDATRNFLKGKPFFEYQRSPFFQKYLQWKEFEKQKITDKYFYEFRTLGQGGFGEVGVQFTISRKEYELQPPSHNSLICCDKCNMASC